VDSTSGFWADDDSQKAPRIRSGQYWCYLDRAVGVLGDVTGRPAEEVSRG
jgi:hypothetical protein